MDKQERKRHIDVRTIPIEPFSQPRSARDVTDELVTEVWRRIDPGDRYEQHVPILFSFVSITLPTYESEETACIVAELMVKHIISARGLNKHASAIKGHLITELTKDLMGEADG